MSKTLIGRLPGKRIGSVAGVSFRVASRLANSLPGGSPVRSASDLDASGVILFHSPPDQKDGLLELLEASIGWAGKSLIFCDCTIDAQAVLRLKKKGASVAFVRQFEIPGYLIMEGNAAALGAAHRLAAEIRFKYIEIADGKGEIFGSAITLATSALTPLIDTAANLLREAGVRDADAPRIACALFTRTTAEYAHSGKQSWTWYLKQPDLNELVLSIKAVGECAKPLFRHLLMYGFELYGKHREIAREIKEPGLRGPGSLSDGAPEGGASAD